MSYQYDYPRPAVSVDMIVLKNQPSHTEVLLIQRKNEPFQDQWALPGGFLDENETLEEAAKRELLEETSLNTRSLQQVAAFSAVNRDPRTRVISIAFLVEAMDTTAAKAADDAKALQWFPLNQLPELAFDHSQILEAALKQSQA